jgi:hypothetical protein
VGLTAKPSVKVGAYITDGTVLLQVRRVLSDGVTAEDAISPTDTPDIVWLSWEQVLAYRSVKRLASTALARSAPWIEELLRG